jgi:hypothetical protein
MISGEVKEKLKINLDYIFYLLDGDKKRIS